MTRRWTTWTGLAAAALLLHLVLIQPNHPGAVTPLALLLFPLELPVLLLALAAMPPASLALRILRWTIVTVLTLLAMLKAADIASFTAFGRAFNPAVDLHLIEAGLRLGAGTFGGAATVLASLALLAAIAGLAACLWWATGRWGALHLPSAGSALAGLAGLAAAAVVLAETGQVMGHWRLPVQPPGAAFATRHAAEKLQDWRAGVADLRAFDRAARSDPYAGDGPWLDLIDSDVLVLFVESYGRSNLEHPLYAPTHRASLAGAETDLAAAGLEMRSAWLRAPTAGGQSWLSHATFANGLWISDQTRYGAVLASERRSLFHFAQQAGFRTAAVMPAITLDWPESAYMGFDTVLAAADLGYAGPAFNWITMPDQYTLTALDRLLSPGGTPPLFANVALVSSHAPWVPVPEVIAWDDVGDGRIYTRWTEGAPTPETVWQDRDRVRAQFRKSVDYALRTVAAYALRHAADPPLMIVLGDHPPAGFVAQDDRIEVPIHLIGPADAIGHTAEWGWSDGLVPAADAPVWGMDEVRDRFLAAYSSAVPRLEASR